MADTTSKHNILVTDNGTIKIVANNASGLKKELEAAGTSAERLAAKVNKAVAPKPAQAAKAARDAGSQAAEDSGTARGVGGLTGAAGRDFAKQSQGLGGLVRLYATFAANIFAATAAFSALSNAMDTSNMVKGLDQLGAASGKNLGTLAKQVYMTTEGAISMREAMESVAKASAAGMSNKQILSMAESAKKASQALGVNMTDAVSRLTRGISKLEPELLDELGLFTKVDKATQDYAKSVGKTALSITDYEKRQAFANAVLAEAKQKFSDIDIPSNPYSKLLASFQNLAQSGLELANKVLTPLLRMLSESPTALAATMAYIGTMILKTAIPALGAWREGLRKAADQAAETSTAFNKSFGDAFQDKMEARFRVPAIDKDLEKNAAAIARARKQLDALARPTSLKAPSIDKLLASDDVSSKAVDALATRKKKQLKDDLEGTAKLKLEKKIAAEEELAYLEKVKIKRQEIADLQAARGKLTKQRGAAFTNIEDAVNVDSKFYDTEKVSELRAQKLASAALKTRLVSNAAEATSIIGVKHALANLHQELVDNGIKGWDKWSTMGKGAVVSVFTRISGIASAFGQIGMMVAAAGLAMQVLDSIFSNNTKEMERTAQALDTMVAALDNVDRTVEHISKKPFLEQISTASIMARSNALGELADSIGGLTSAMDKEIKTSGVYEKITQGFLSVFGRDDITKAAKKTALAINEAFKLALPSKTKSNAEADMIKLLGVSPTDINGMVSKLSNDYVTLGTKSEEIASKLVADMRKVAGAATQLDESFTTAGKSYDAVVNSAMPTDHLAKLGMDTVAMANNMAEAFKSPVSAMNQLVKISGDISKLRFLDPKTAEQLFNMGPAISKGVEKIQELNAVLEKADLAQQEIDIKRKELEQRFGKAGAKFNNAIKESGLDSRQAGVSEARNNAMKSMAQAEATVLPLMKNLKKIQDESFARGADLVKNSIAIGFREAAITVQKAWASTLPSDTSGAINENARIEKASLNIQADQIRASLGLIDSMAKLTLVQEKANIMKEREELNKDPKNSEYKQYRLSQLAIRETAVDGLMERGDAARYKGKQAVSNLTADLNGNGLVQRAQAQMQMGSVFQRNAKEAELAKNSAQATAIEIKKQADLLTLTYTKKKEQLVLDTSGLNVQKSKNELEVYGSEYLTDSQLATKQELDRQIEFNNNLKDQLDIAGKLAQLQVTLNNGTGDRAKTEESITETRERQRILTESQNNAAKLAEDSRAKDILVNAKNIFTAEQNIAKLREDSASSGQSNIISIQEEQLSVLSNIGAVSDEYIAKQNTSIALAKEELRSTEAIRAARAAINEAAFNRSQLGPGVDTTKYDVQIAAGVQAILNEQKLTEAKKNTITEQGKMNVLVAQQAELMSKLADATTSLSVVFGSVGEALGTSLTKLVEFGDSQTKYQEKSIALEKQKQDILNDPDLDPSVRNKAAQAIEKEQAKLQDKNSKDQIANMANIAGAAKKMFNERSAGYKVLNGIEKALHAFRIASMIAEAATAIATTGPVVAANTAKAASGGVTAIIDAMKGIPTPYNFIAGAAMAVYVASILGKSVGGSAQMPAGFDAASQQKVQGTGQMYQDGQLVNRGGGALGDSTAKANSLNNSIAKIEEHSFSTMEYSNDMLKNLQAIKTNTEGLAAMILQSGLNTSGLDANGNVITSEGTNAVQGRGLGVGSMLESGGIGLDNIFKIVGLSSNSGLGKGLAKISNSLWGGKTSTELLDAGIAFSGNINSLIKSLNTGGDAVNAFYQNVKTTIDGGLFKSDKTKFTTEKSKLEDIQAEAFANIFKNIGDTVTSAAKALGKDPAITSSIMDSFDLVFKTSFQGLKPEEVTAALEQEFSVTFNQLAEKVLPEFQKFRKPGEEFGDTIVRIARDVQVTSLSLEKSGLVIGDVAKAMKSGESIQEATVRITESLIDLSGGLDKFVTQSDFFNGNFLTDAERLAPVQKRVTTELDRLQEVAGKAGISVKIAGLNTREGFANAVKYLSSSGALLTTEGQTLYAGLMNVAEGFAEVYPETRTTTSALADLKKRNIELNDTYDKLTMSSQAYNAKLVANYTEEEKTLFYANKALEEFNTGISDTQKLIDDITMAGFTTDLEKITYTRAKERANIEASNYAIFDLVTGLQVLQSGLSQARRDIETASNTLRSAFSSAQSALASASGAILSAQQGAQSTYDQAVADLAAGQSQAAQDAASAAASAAADMAQAAQDARNAMIDLSTSIKDFIKELVTSDLGLGTQETKLQNLKSQFADTLAKAKKGDKDALSAVPEVARNLLTAAQAQSKSKIDYMKTYGLVTNELSSITKAIDAANGTQKIETSSSGSSGGGSSVDLSGLFAAVEKARADLEKKNADAKEAGIDVNAQQDTLIETWRKSNDNLNKIKDTLDRLGIKYDDLLLKPEDAYKAAITTYESATASVATYTAALGAASQTLAELISASNASRAAAEAAAQRAADAANNAAAGTTPDGNKTNMPVPNTPDGRKTSQDAGSAMDSAQPSGTAQYTTSNGGANGKYSVPLYASGGYFDGGLRIVGERGPELEATGPARIWSADQTRGMMQGAANDELLAEIRALRLEVSSLRMTSEQTEAHTRKTKDTLIRVSENGNSLKTTAA